MKKLLFSFVGAAAFAALASDPSAGANDIDVLGFENFDLNSASVTGAVVDRDDTGVEGTSKWSCSGDDASLVKTYGGDNAAKGSGLSYPGPFSDEGDQYLALDTNGSELQRAIPSVGQAIAADGTYIDTLVQFTPSESAPSAGDLTGAKLAIWLGVVENVTNLYVQGGFLEGPVGEGTPTIDTTATQAYKLGNIQVEPGQWYRLTVKAIKLDDDGAGNTISGFQILVDGTLAVSDTAVADAAGIQYYTDYAAEAGVFPGAAELLSAKTVIPSCAGVIADATLTSVGFKGTGALDDFVVTTEAPDFGPAAIDFSLTWPAGLTAVSYQIGEGEPVAISGTSPFAVPGLAAGDVVKFIVANADGAQKTLTGTAGTDTGLDATNETFGWPEYLGAAVDGAYEIDDADELVLFQKGVAAGLTTASTTFKLTDDVTLATAWPGVGIQNGKDLVSGTNEAHFVSKEYHIAEYDAGAFKGTFDGQNYTISGFQMQGGNLDYCGFFNSIKDATIQNLKIAYKENKFATDSSSSTSESGATFVGVAKSSTLQNLTTIAGSVTDVTCAKGFGGIVGYHMAGTTVESCTNNINLTSAKNNKAGGISMITQGGTGSAIVRNCQNNGTTAGNANQKGGVVGYVGAATTIENCTVTANSDPTFLHNEKQTVTIQGTNKAPAGVRPYTYTNNKVAGLNFATVDNGVATFVADNALALNGEYKVMAAGATATYEFAAAGSISFDTNMIQAVTFAITAPGLDLTEATESGVVTFTAAAQGGDDYVVEIEGSDVVITPQAGDLEALAEAGVDTNSVAAVNAALATTIEGTSIPAWQALFLGVAPTAAGLETVAIKSISIAADGTVTVEMADGVTLKTGRGVDIKLKLMGSTDLTNWTQIGSDITNTKVIPAITPAQGETKKFYKVVVDFAGSQN